jgi:hypothetical protein
VRQQVLVNGGRYRFVRYDPNAHCEILKAGNEI